MSNYKFILLGCFLNLSSPFDEKNPPKNIPPKESDYFEANEKIKKSLVYKAAMRNQSDAEYFLVLDKVYYVRKDGKIRTQTPYERYIRGYDD